MSEMVRLTGEEYRALSMVRERGEFDNAYRPGQRRIPLSVWAALRHKGCIAEGYPYRLADQAMIDAALGKES